MKQNEASLFFHPFESYTEEQRQVWIRQQLKDIYTHAVSHSEYYQKKFDGLQLDMNDTYPLKKFPTLAASDLRENLPPVNNALLTQTQTGYSVFQSGGTTGAPKTSLFTHAEMEGINECNLRGFHAVGLSPNDRVANLWAVGGLYMTFIHMNRMLQQYGCVSFPFSNATPFDFINNVAQQFNINVFSGITSVVLNCLRDIHHKSPGKLKIEKIFFGGEHIYDNDRKEMQDLFGVNIIKAPGYGTVDSWYLGYQCSSCANGVFHAFDDYVYLEFINEETGEHCLPGEIGMMYATIFPRRLTPIIRFKVGDRARWLGHACSCGRTTPLFELLGRGDDVLRIGYDSVDYNFVQQVLMRVPGSSARVQMEKKRLQGKDKLILRIETNSDATEHAKMSEILNKIFLAERPSFSEFVKKDQIWPLEIEWLKEGTLPQNPRTGKLIRVIDSIS